MDEGAQTVPNFLKNYRDMVIGGSLGYHLGEVREKFNAIRLEYYILQWN